jgi:hypothetical protein
MTDSLLEFHSKKIASPNTIKEARQKSSIHFVRGQEVLSILDKYRDDF